MINKYFVYFLLIAILLLVIWVFYRKNFKRIKVPAICLITGGVKTGKSLLSVKLAVKDYRRRHRVWFVKSLLRGKKKKKLEEPLFYTNTFISFGDCRKKKQHRLNKNIRLIELEHLMREKRFNYGSVVYICESSLMSDSQDYNNQKRNAELSMFNKLFGHETKGGILYYDTQSPLDNHYSIKRVMSTYFMIQKSLNFILFRVLYVREMINTDLGENNFNTDVEETMRKVLIGRWWYHRYDRYYYSYLTDKLPKRTKKPRWYYGALTSFNPLYVNLSKKGEKKKNEKVN